MSAAIKFPLIPLKAGADGIREWRELEFLYTVKAAKELEEVAGTSAYILSLRGQSVRACVLMLWKALIHQDASLTENKAAGLLQKYLDGGGKIKPLMEALVKAMNESGVYGDPEAPEMPGDDEGDAPDPPTTTTD